MDTTKYQSIHPWSLKTRSKQVPTKIYNSEPRKDAIYQKEFLKKIKKR
jgi:hypothetical protein